MHPDIVLQRPLRQSDFSPSLILFLFQLQNGILLPSLRPALPFVDLHDIKRYEFHQSVLDELRERLLRRVVEIANSDDKLKYIFFVVI